MASRWLHDPEYYYDLLAADAVHLDVWTTEYLQALTGTDAVLEWVTATSLRPILAGLSDADRETYLNAYRERLRCEYPSRPDGTTLYPLPPPVLRCRARLKPPRGRWRTPNRLLVRPLCGREFCEGTQALLVLASLGSPVSAFPPVS